MPMGAAQLMHLIQEKHIPREKLGMGIRAQLQQQQQPQKAASTSHRLVCGTSGLAFGKRSPVKKRSQLSGEDILNDSAYFRNLMQM
jgi:hypothetical protein